MIIGLNFASFLLKLRVFGSNISLLSSVKVVIYKIQVFFSYFGALSTQCKVFILFCSTR